MIKFFLFEFRGKKSGGKPGLRRYKTGLIKTGPLVILGVEEASQRTAPLSAEHLDPLTPELQKHHIGSAITQQDVQQEEERPR